MRTLVVYAARNGRQTQVPVEVADGATVRDAIDRSGLLKQFTEIDLDQQMRVKCAFDLDALTGVSE